MEKFIPYLKAFQDGRTLKKGTKTANAEKMEECFKAEGFLLLLFSLGYVFLLFCNNVSCHAQLNLS